VADAVEGLFHRAVAARAREAVRTIDEERQALAYVALILNDGDLDCSPLVGAPPMRAGGLSEFSMLVKTDLLNKSAAGSLIIAYDGRLLLSLHIYAAKFPSAPCAWGASGTVKLDVLSLERAFFSIAGRRRCRGCVISTKVEVFFFWPPLSCSSAPMTCRSM
jgi:hypothetical protein